MNDEIHHTFIKPTLGGIWTPEGPIFNEYMSLIFLGHELEDAQEIHDLFSAEVDGVPRRVLCRGSCLPSGDYVCECRGKRMELSIVCAVDDGFHMRACRFDLRNPPIILLFLGVRCHCDYNSLWDRSGEVGSNKKRRIETILRI